MTVASASIRVGFVPILRPLFRGAQMGIWQASRDRLAALGPELGYELALAAEPVTDAGEAERTAAAVEAAKLDFVLIQHTTFATGDLVVPFLERPIPLGVWGLPEVEVAGRLPQNSLCGVNMTLSLPAARSLPAKWFFGGADDPAFVRRLGATVRALRGRRALREGRILQVGGTAPGFYRLNSVPELALSVERIPLEEGLAAIERVSDAEAAEALAALDEYSPMSREQLKPAMKIEIALERLSRGYDGVAMRCWPEVPEQCGGMACAAFGRLADRGRSFACEGDVTGLASMLAVAAVTGGPAALLDLVHAADGELMFWHCGNAPRAWAAEGRTRLDPHFNRKIAAVRDMRLRGGPASGLRLVEGGQALVYAGDVREREAAYDGVSGWVGNLRWAGTPLAADEFVASVFNHRLPHHFTWGLGDHEDALLELADWMGLAVLPPAPVARSAGSAPGMVRWAAS